ncbi:MAG: glycosyltransferase, partial [Nanoarchaeota archaeon]
MEKVSIIIPAYNEEKRIGETLDSNLRFFKALKKNKILDFEIIVVVNGSSDKTFDIVKDFSKKNKELKYLNLKRGAKGYAVIEGFKEALKSDSNLIGFKDADMATSPEAFYDLVNKINNYDGIIASRYVKGSIINPKPSLERIFASRIFNFMIRTILGLQFKDTQCGAKLFKRKTLEKTIPRLTLSQLAFDVDLLYNIKKQGF